MNRILWLAKNEPMAEQLEDLKRLFPGAEVVLDTKEVRSTEDAITRIRAGRYTEVVAVLSWSILSQLTQRGIYPIYAKVSRVKGELKHTGFFVCRGVDIKLDPLEA